MLNLPNDIDSLKSLIKQLIEKNERLEAENAELRRRLGLDSHNSDKPPSSNGYKKKSLKPGIPKTEKRALGGQAGHPGKTLKRVEHPDEIQLHLPKQCRCCQRPFTKEHPYEIIQTRQVFDLPAATLTITEHHIGQISCCGQVQRGQYPQGVTAPVQYGPGDQAIR